MSDPYLRKLTKMVLEIDGSEADLNNWEINFIDSMLQKLPILDDQQQDFEWLSKKQISTIETLYRKYM